MPCATQNEAMEKSAVGGPRIGGTFTEAAAPTRNLRPVTSARAILVLHLNRWSTNYPAGEISPRTVREEFEKSYRPASTSRRNLLIAVGSTEMVKQS